MSDFDQEEEDEENGYNKTKLRMYEINKMKYYYAVVHCNSKKTAEKIYDEYNGMEIEQTSIPLSLSFVADTLEFPQKPIEVVNFSEVDTTVAKPQQNGQSSRALSHTNVKLTWDETDPQRSQ